ncbi:B-cell receptor CD22-like isoform X2 [Argiope bruennichi]|uniref:B-cell receptor CD22-like isoform X2 n=1 Tax=Argiope bruennichi TaxID=94029 RepID=UPI002493FB24|nr:B-cell receptor CD22-like isoform X2 [Argiope bruennichi]
MWKMLTLGSRNIGPCKFKTVIFALLWIILSSTSFVINAEEEKSVHRIGIVGSSVELPCDVDVSNCGKVYFITWTKNVSNDWKRLYLYSDAVVKPLQELANPGRAEFFLEESSAFLRISPLRIEDDGIYKCDVTYVQGKCPSLSFATLTTYAPPSVPSIEKDGKMSLNGSVVGPFYEGAVLNLECETFGGKPTPEVSWFKGEEELDSESHVRVEKNGASTVTSTVKMTLERDDLGAKIECHVDNEAIDDALVSWVEVDLHVGPSSLEVDGPDDPVTAGEFVTLTCTIEGAKPAANATWFNRSEVLNIMPQTELQLAPDGTFTTISTVEVPVSRHDHQGTYYCKGSNSVLQAKGEAPLLKSLDIQVLYPPAVVMQPTGGVIVNESDSAIIYCTYEANPFNVTDVHWFHEDQSLAVPTAGKYESSMQGYPTLTVRNVVKEDRGMYSCSLANAVGRGNATNYAEVNVLFPPVVEATISPEDVKEGNSISLFCDIVEGNPQNLLRVRWFKEDEMLHETTEREIVWVGVTRNSSGIYSCEGENAAGWGGRSEEKELIVQYLPGPAFLTELDSPAIKGETSSLQCIVEEPGLPPASVYRWERDGELLATTSSENYTTDIHRVNSKGNYSCSAVNEVGVGPKGFEYIPVYAPPTFIQDLPDIRGAARDAPFISFECRVECEPICEIMWTKDGERVTNSELYIVRNRIIPEDILHNRFRSVTSTLQFNMTAWPGRRLERDRDRANYTCMSTPNMVGDGVSSSMLFLVEYPPEAMSLSDSVIQVHEGNVPPDVECSASSWPPSTYMWLRGENRDMVMARDDTLSFNDSVTREHGGKYVCVAENRHGKAQIEMKLEVLYKPECVVSETTNEAGVAILMCKADGFPTKINFTWSKDNETLDDEFDMDSEADDHSVYVLPSSAERYGLYACIAINDVGVSRPCERMVSGPGLAGWHAEFGDKNVLVIAAIIGSIAILFVLAIIIIILIMRKRRLRNFSSPGKTPLGTGGDSLYQNVSGAPVDPKQNGPSAPESEGNVMYENMPFHRQGPYKPDSSDEMVYADLYDDVKAGKVPDPRMKPPLPPKGIGKKPKEPPLPPKTKKGGLFDSLGI